MQCTETEILIFEFLTVLSIFEFYAEFKLLNWKASKLFCNFDISSSPSDFIAFKVHPLNFLSFLEILQFRQSSLVQDGETKSFCYWRKCERFD